MKLALDAAKRKAFMTNLSRYLLAAGLDQKTLAAKLEVSPAAVSRWCSGMDIPKPKRIKQLAKLIGVEPIELTRVIEPELVAK